MVVTLWAWQRCLRPGLLLPEPDFVAEKSKKQHIKILEFKQIYFHSHFQPH